MAESRFVLGLCDLASLSENLRHPSSVRKHTSGMVYCFVPPNMWVTVETPMLRFYMARVDWFHKADI